MSIKTPARAAEGWVKACERNKRFEDGTATEEDWAALREWLAGLEIVPPALLKDTP